MPTFLHNSKFVSWFRRMFSLGVVTDVRPELLKDGLYSDAQNMRPAQVDGNTGGLETIRGLTRLFATGALDPAWDLGTGFSGGPVYVVLVDTFGDLVVGGAFTSLDGNTYNRVVKLT